MMSCGSELLLGRLAQAEGLWLFLDYDGTLADFAPTPAHVEPDPEIISLLGRLEKHPRIRVAVVSGRRLAHVAMLVPVPGVLLAGTYGIELQTFKGRRVERVPYQTIRPILDTLKPHWERLIADRQGFFLEDKGWALALHARFAEDDQARKVLDSARHAAVGLLSEGELRLLGGHKFLEIGPQAANKGLTITYLLERYPWPEALPLYLGDDDKDEEAFAVVKAREGLAIVVAREPRDTHADCRLESPRAARDWLRALLARFDRPRLSLQE
jgi:trehalose 6-phosphate phosphatase